MDYPKAKYSKSEPVRVVQNEKEEKLLGPEWFDTPNFTNTKPGSPGQVGSSVKPPAIVSYGPTSTGPERRHGAMDTRPMPHVERRAVK